MESKSKSYRQFYNKLIITTSLFIIALFIYFHEYARSTVYDDIQDNMLKSSKTNSSKFYFSWTIHSCNNQFQTIDIVKKMMN